MTVKDNNIQKNSQNILELLQRLEIRVKRIENYLDLSPDETPLKGSTDNAIKITDEGEETRTADKVSLEVEIGEYWLARVGAIVLLMGMAFFISYPLPMIPPFFASLLGFVAVVLLFGLARYWQKSYLYLSRILFGGCQVLLYFATLKLHFFSSNPLIPGKVFGLILLIFVLGINIYISIKKQSEILAIIQLILCFATAIISEHAQVTLALFVISAATAVYLLIKFNWHTAAILSLIMVYSAHLLWLFNSPVLGHPIKPIVNHHNDLFYLVLYGAIYGLANIFRRRDSYSGFFEIVLTVFNGMGIMLIGALNVQIFFKTQISLLGFLTFLFFMTIAIFNWKKTKSKYSTSIYASFGYLALSVAIFAQYKYPDYFIWLSWQSLLVIITALWFRSRIIIVANIIIYVSIFLIYLPFSTSHNFVNLSYAITALTSARVLNWKKERLELKTDFIRNTYLACTYIIVLYGLYFAVPGNVVSLAWLGAVLFYFGLSLLLKNIKYRWLAILTIFATVIHVFLIDMSRLSAGFRVILFLAVGIVILLLSLLYSRYRKKTYESK